MPDSLLLRCPWVLLHSWTFGSGTLEGLEPSGAVSIIEDPYMGHALQIFIAKSTYGGGSATGLLDTAPYHDSTLAYKIEFWYWCDYARNSFYRPSIAFQIETGGIFRSLVGDMANYTLIGINRSAGVWYRVVMMVWTTENIIDSFVYGANGALLNHSRGTYPIGYSGRPTAIRANVVSSYSSSEDIQVRFANIAVSYTLSLSDPSLRRRRAAWMNLERPAFF